MHTADCTCIALVCVSLARPSLSLPEQVEAMVNYIVNEPAEDASDKLKFVYPYKVTPLPVSPPQRLPVPCLLCSLACARVRARFPAGIRLLVSNATSSQSFPP